MEGGDVTKASGRSHLISLCLMESQKTYRRGPKEEKDKIKRLLGVEKIEESGFGVTGLSLMDKCPGMH